MASDHELRLLEKKEQNLLKSIEQLSVAKNEKVSLLHNQLSGLTEQKNQLEAVIRTLKSQKQQLELSVEGAKKSLKEFSDKEMGKLFSNISEKEQRVNKKSERLQAVENHLRKKSAEINALERSLEDKNNQIERKLRLLETEQSSMENRRIKAEKVLKEYYEQEKILKENEINLKESCQNMTMEMENTARIKTQLNKEIEKIDKEIEEKKVLISRTMKNLQKRTEFLDDKEKELKSLEGKIAEDRRKLKVAFDEYRRLNNGRR